MTELERLWIGRDTPVPAEQVQRMREIVPACKINTTTDDPHGDAWRFTDYDPEIPKYYWVPRYELLREQMGYNYQEYSFYWLDPLCEREAPAEYRGMIAIVSDPVDNLAAAFLDAAGLEAWQIQGYGLGVMNMRALYYSQRLEGEAFALYESEGRAFGPHGQDLVIANSIHAHCRGVNGKSSSMICTPAFTAIRLSLTS